MEKCKCENCPYCAGSGTVYYLLGECCGPAHPMDDLAEQECCEECDGVGVLSFCDKCMDEFRDEENMDY